MTLHIVRSIVLTIGVSLMSTLASARSDMEIDSAARQYLSKQARTWMQNPIVVDAVKQQNRVNASLSQSEIDRLDEAWRRQAERGGGPLIDSLLSNSLSTYLKTVQNDTRGLLTEIFVMDNKGLNVGQSSVTSDLWQGDEDKWQKTCLQGPSAVFVDEVEFDDSSQLFQVQVSVSVVDPANGKVIGAVTMGIDAEGLLLM